MPRSRASARTLVKGSAVCPVASGGPAHWNRDAIWDELKAIADALGVKVKDFLAPLFVAIAGSSASFSVVDSMEMLGPDMSRARIRHAIEVLGGVSKKAMKRLEKEYQALRSAGLAMRLKRVSPWQAIIATSLFSTLVRGTNGIQSTPAGR